MAKSLQIFEPNKGVHISILNLVALVSSVAIVIIWCLKYSELLDMGFYPILFTFIWALIFLFQLFVNNFKEKPLRGKFNGFITLSDSYVEVRGKKYMLDELRSIRFKNIWDIKGTHDSGSIPFVPKTYNGTSNQLVLDLNDGRTLKYNFLQTESKQIKQFPELLIAYYKRKKIPWKKLVYYLGLGPLEIHKLKREIDNS